MTEEIWKSIPGYDGYEVSNLGRVRSWWRKIGKGLGNGQGYGGRVIDTDYRIQKQHVDSDGYNITSATGDDGIHRSLKVHRLVAIAFIPNPDNLPQINHKNEVKTDNRVENLEWCDCRYNVNYGTRNKRMATTRGKVVARYDLQGNYIESFESAAEAERITGFKHVASACVGDRDSAGDSQWRYTDSTENIGFYVKKKHEPVNRKSVDCLDLEGNYIRTYASIKEAAKDKGLRDTDIVSVLKGRQKTAHGFIWKYHNES